MAEVGGRGACDAVDQPRRRFVPDERPPVFDPAEATIFSGVAANGTLAASAFVAGTAALDASDRIIYDSATGKIFYDADGVGGVAQVLFATVDPGTALNNADFFGFI